MISSKFVELSRININGRMEFILFAPDEQSEGYFIVKKAFAGVPLGNIRTIHNEL